MEQARAKQAMMEVTEKVDLVEEDRTRKGRAGKDRAVRDTVEKNTAGKDMAGKDMVGLDMAVMFWVGKIKVKEGRVTEAREILMGLAKTPL